MNNNHIVQKITIAEWFRDYLAPELKKVSDIITKTGKERELDVRYGEWWGDFVKETFALFEIIPKENQTRQFALTMRSLIEFAADVRFMAKNPNNIKRLWTRAEKFANKKISYTYKDIARESSHCYLKRDNTEGDGETSTKERIKEAFSKDVVYMYDYLNCFAHFNIFGIRINLNIYQAKDGSMLRERLILLQYYPEIFKTVAMSLSEICGIEEIKKYDYSKIETIIKDTLTNWEEEKG